MAPVMAVTATGTMRHMGLYIDPSTNSLGVVTGGTTVHSLALDPPFVDFPANSIPSARVLIYGGQNGILEADISDARRPFTPFSARYFFVRFTASVAILFPSRSFTEVISESLGTATTHLTGLNPCFA